MIDEESGVRAKQYFACRAHKEGDKLKNCSICKLQMKNPQLFDSHKNKNMKLYMNEVISFSTFIEYLLPPSIDLEGCEVQFPDSLFFKEDGQPSFIAKTEPHDGKIVMIS